MTKSGLLLLRGPILWTTVIPNSDQCDQISRNELFDKIRKNFNKARYLYVVNSFLVIGVEFYDGNRIFKCKQMWIWSSLIMLERENELWYCDKSTNRFSYTFGPLMLYFELLKINNRLVVMFFDHVVMLLDWPVLWNFGNK